MGTNILTEIISILTGGITGVASGIGQGLSTLAKDIFLQTTEGVTSLSAFGALVVIFAGIALSLHLCRWVVNFVTSLGQRNR